MCKDNRAEVTGAKKDEKSSGIGLPQNSKEEVAVLARCTPFDHLTKRLLVFPIEDVPHDS